MRVSELGIMAKFPIPGRAKTRLLSALTPEQAAVVQTVFLRHVRERAAELLAWGTVLTFCDPPDYVGQMAALLGHRNRHERTVFPQADGDLGVRIAAAVRAFGDPDRHARTGTWRDAVLIVGTDSPDVPREHLLAALTIAGETDVTLGPTDDGGFWCIGVSPGANAAELLANVEWSSGRERAQVLERAERLGYKSALAPPWDDVDHPGDLRRLVGRLTNSERDEDRRLLQALWPALPEGLTT